MLIRPEQAEALRQVPIDVFTSLMLDGLRTRFPHDCRVLGEAQTRTAIALGIVRAHRHGIDDANDAARFITLMFALGSFFDDDPQLAWASAALAGARKPTLRMRTLYADATEFVRRTAGEDGEIYRRALLRLRRCPLEKLAEDGDLSAMLGRVWGEKVLFMRHGTVPWLLAAAPEAAAAHRVDTPEGIALYTTLMLLLGSRFDSDPLHPWAVAALRPDDVAPGARVRVLYAAAAARLQQALEPAP
jgi:hypothetical protein